MNRRVPLWAVLIAFLAVPLYTVVTSQPPAQAEIPPISKFHTNKADANGNGGAAISGDPIFATNITPADSSHPHSVWTIQAGINSGGTTAKLQRLVYDADGALSYTQDLFTTIGNLTPGAVYVGSIAAITTAEWNLTFSANTTYDEVIVYEHQD